MASEGDAGADAAAVPAVAAPEVAPEVAPAVELPPSVVSPDAIPQLTSGLIASVVPPLDIIEHQLKEMRESQEAVIETLETQSTALKDDEKFQEVIETMSLLSLFHGKLLTVRKDMMLIAEKTSKMKKRLEKLETKKVKLATKQAKEQEQARMHEESLRARPVAELDETAGPS